MRIAKCGKLLSKFYKDKMTVYRSAMVKQTSGITKQQLSDTPLYIDIPCKISFNVGVDQSNTQTETINPIVQQIKIICAANADIKKGDKLVIKQYDEDGNIIETYEGMTGNKPISLITHKEILFTEIGDA